MSDRILDARSTESHNRFAAADDEGDGPHGGGVSLRHPATASLLDPLGLAVIGLAYVIELLLLLVVTAGTASQWPSLSPSPGAGLVGPRAPDPSESSALSRLDARAGSFARPR